MKMHSNQKVEENKPALKFNFTLEYMHSDMMLFIICGHPLSHWALMCTAGINIMMLAFLPPVVGLGENTKFSISCLDACIPT